MSGTVIHQGAEIGMSRSRHASPLAIATLGPAGTSSEVAAEFLAERLRRPPEDRASIRLCDTYEQAAQMIIKRSAQLLIVANAYAGISRFYMNPQFCLAAAFVRDTPPYGLAARDDGGQLKRVRVATHPAPEPLIAELLPAEYQLDAVLLVNSTSAAAAAVRSGAADLALTTAPAASAYGLRFLSRTRTIRMLWSVFARRDLVRAGPERPATRSRYPVTSPSRSSR